MSADTFGFGLMALGFQTGSVGALLLVSQRMLANQEDLAPTWWHATLAMLAIAAVSLAVAAFVGHAPDGRARDPASRPRVPSDPEGDP